MSTELPLLRGTITYSNAWDHDTNILHRLRFVPARDKFFNHIDQRHHLTKEIVAHHLGLSPAICHVANRDAWMNGSFNLCVPVVVGTSRVLVRFPLPYRVGDRPYPGNGDEKVRCEAGTYAWLQKECPSIPVPHYYGVGLSSGQAVRCSSDIWLIATN